jgi:hypothetical protein
MVRHALDMALDRNCRFGLLEKRGAVASCATFSLLIINILTTGNFVPCNEITRFFCPCKTRLPAFETHLPADFYDAPPPLPHVFYHFQQR